MNEKNLNLNEIWRVCRKIQNAVYHYGYCVEDYFKFYDPSESGIISESKFVNILNQLKNCLGLSDFEIKEVTEYFSIPNGRVAYKQFCEVISEDQDKSKNLQAVNGLEWNDPLHVNNLSPFETRELCMLLVKIAQTVRLRDIVLMPYFQDYELVTKNNETVTIPHFSRVLHFMKIVLSEKDFILLLKRYLKDSYTVNYVAFVKDIEEIVRYLDNHRLTDFSQDIIENFPGRIIDVGLPKLPRPEIGSICIADVFGKETSFHSALCKKQNSIISEKEIFLRIQKHVLENRIKVHEFLSDFDIMKCGYITKNQFLRALDNIGISGLHRLHLSPDELEIICNKYLDHYDINRCNWKKFENDVNEVFAITGLDKTPYRIVECPPKEVLELQKPGRVNWQEQKSNIRDLCEETLFKLKKKISSRGLYFHQFFKDFDKCNLGHVSRSQLRKVIATNGIILSDEEYYALEKRYNDDQGFNYVWFLTEADPKDAEKSHFVEVCPPLKAKNVEKPIIKEDLDIVSIMAKIKKQAVTKRVRVLDFLKDYDKLNHETISDSDFRRGINNANIQLTENQLDVICEIFKTPFRCGYIDYKRFCKIIDEVFYQSDLEKAPLLIPLQHFPAMECKNCFLNFEERTIVSAALQKLSKKPDHISNLSSLFEDYDRERCGSVTRSQFLRALTVRNLINLISSREFDTVCKCFGVERGACLEVDYRLFLRALLVIFEAKQKYPF